MKVYVLVEGISSEMSAYPAWFESLLPGLPRIKIFDDYLSAEKGVFFISGMGYPSILNHIDNAVADADKSNTDYLFIIIDSDEDSPNDREKVIDDLLGKTAIPQRLNICKCIQNRCFETIILGNDKIIPRNPTGITLIDYKNYYDVNQDDPELMGNYNKQHTHAQFHYKYAIAAIRERRIKYTKANCSDIATADFINTVINRANRKKHLRFLSNFVSYINQIRMKLGLSIIPI